MEFIKLKRINKRDDYIIGILYSLDKFICLSMEPAWKGNQRFISCIPKGLYECCWNEDKSKYLVKNVLGRENIMIEVLNTPSQTAGCIGVGLDYYDDKIHNSGAALMKLRQNAGAEFILEIL